MPRSNDETANREPAHDLQEILEHITSHVDVRLSAPMSSSVLGLHSAPRAHLGPAAGSSFCDGHRTTAPAGRPRPADPVGYCGRRCVAGHCGLEPAMRSRRWRSDAVGPAHGCPELVKPILHTDIGVGMSSHFALDKTNARLVHLDKALVARSRVLAAANTSTATQQSRRRRQGGAH